MSNNSKVLQEQRPRDSGDSSTMASNGNSYVVTDSSWGDKFKKTSFAAIVDGAINYVVNTLLSVSLAYYFDRKLDKHVQEGSLKIGKAIANYTGGNGERWGHNIHMGAKGFTLTWGGTALVPVVKYAKDHRNEYEFKIGHALDVVQDKLGLANSATEENLREYTLIKKAVESGKAPEASQEDLDRFKSQHHVMTNDKGEFAFKERKASWTKAIIARAFAWGAAFGTNFTLDRFIGLGKRLEDIAPAVSATLTQRVKGYDKLADRNKFSQNLLNDAILTVSSSITQAVADKTMDREKKIVKKVPSVAPSSPPADGLDKEPSKWASQVQPAADKISPEALKPVEGHLAQVEKSKAAANDTSLAVRA